MKDQTAGILTPYIILAAMVMTVWIISKQTTKKKR